MFGQAIYLDKKTRYQRLHLLFCFQSLQMLTLVDKLQIVVPNLLVDTRFLARDMLESYKGVFSRFSDNIKFSNFSNMTDVSTKQLGKYFCLKQLYSSLRNHSYKHTTKCNFLYYISPSRVTVSTNKYQDFSLWPMMDYIINLLLRISFCLRLVLNKLLFLLHLITTFNKYYSCPGKYNLLLLLLHLTPCFEFAIPYNYFLFLSLYFGVYIDILISLYFSVSRQ